MAVTEAGALPLGTFDLVVAGGLVLLAGIVSVAMGLGLGRRLAMAALRTVVQLILIGYTLQWIFGLDSAPLVMAWLALMILAAGRAAVQRPVRWYRGVLAHAWLTLLISATLTTFSVTGAIIGVDPWYEPQYLIPLMGMCLGNALTGISLCLDALLESLVERRSEVELRLCLGATSWEAARPMVQQAIRRGMLPILNTMTVVGVVSLPGMMTGQILAGADPLQAVKYQIVVMFMLAATTAIGCIIMTLLMFKSLFSASHQLRAKKIMRRP